MHAMPRAVWPLFGSLRGEGIENVPAQGPFLLLSNHQSVLDPFFIQTLIPRPCHALAKSTQFGGGLFAAVMKRCYAFPVRRFQVDPQAVRIVLRRLAQGHPVHIYVEGERTWDGTLQPPRPGTVRLALKAGVPIVPCAISGAYEVWPRWARAPRRGDVRVAVGQPFLLPRLDDRREREAALPDAAARIIGAIADLAGMPAPALRDADG
jgi:1-acyl-sn-glycerol-3-phosphate acyltransferase